MKTRSISASAIAASVISVTVASMPAHGQNEGTQGSGSLEEITVTGSRIARPDYAAESPIATVDAAALAVSGPQTLDATFNTLPQFSASNANSSSSPARQGRSNANLRGLGIQRTLVLLDGRRMTPSDPLGAIDLNVISSSLIENVEVITGGASAVYGSDAVAGVVNFRLKRDFEGLEINAEYGVTDRSDGESYNVGVTMGGNFAEGRGNAMASMTFYERKGVLRGSRPFFERSGIAGVLQGGVVQATASNLPSLEALEDIFVEKYGLSMPNRNAPLGMYPDGTLFTTQAPILNFDPDRLPYIIDENRVGFPQGATYPLQQPLERYTAFARARYDITDSIEAYAQFSLTKYDSEYSRQGWSGSSDEGTFIPVTNPFISEDLAHILASRPNPTAPFSFQFNTGRVGRSVYQNDYEISDFLVGLRGNLPISDWTWDVYASHGEMRAGETLSGFIDYAAWKMLVEAPDGGASICPGGFNPFAIEALADRPDQEACYRLLNRTLQERTMIEQDVVEATMQGKLFSLPAGEARFAAGFTYRAQSYDYRPPEERIRSEVIPNQPTDRTGGSFDVSEAFVEISVPVLSDLPLIHQLSLGLAYRYSDYSTIDEVGTYKASMDWRITPALRMRGGVQRAIRAPSLGELYLPAERASSSVGSTSLGGGDPCDSLGRLRNPATNPNHERVRQLCLEQGVPENVIDIFRFTGSAVSGVAFGNLDLKEETADTFTAGIVWDSGFSAPLLRRLSMSLDYYKIDVEDAIGVVTAAVGMNRCFNADGVSNPNYDINNFFCRLTTRTENGNVQTQLQPTLNLSAYRTSGIDFQSDWGFDLADIGINTAGSLRFNLMISYLLSFEIQNLAGEPFTDYVGTIGNAQIDSGAISKPEWRANLSASFARGPLDVTLRYRWIDSMYHASDAGTGTKSQPGVTDRSYTDLLAGWSFTDTVSMRVGVINLFDTEPPTWTGNGSTDLGLYDLLQRRYFVNFTKRF
jgi:iron complex outermembrane receptor protein